MVCPPERGGHRAGDDNRRLQISVEVGRVEDAEFRTVVTRGPEATTIEVIGELDTFTARELSRSVDEALAHGDRVLIFDLAKVSLGDSSGLGVLGATLKRPRPRGGRMSLRRVRPPAQRILEVTGLTKVFDIDAG